MLDGYSGSPCNVISKGRKMEHVLMTDAAGWRQNTVVDYTNLTRKIRRRHVELGRKHGATTNAVFFQNVPRTYERNGRRPEPLEEWILDGKRKELEPPREDEGFGYVQIMR